MTKQQWTTVEMSDEVLRDFFPFVRPGGIFGANPVVLLDDKGEIQAVRATYFRENPRRIQYLEYRNTGKSGHDYRVSARARGDD